MTAIDHGVLDLASDMLEQFALIYDESPEVKALSAEDRIILNALLLDGMKGILS